MNETEEAEQSATAVPATDDSGENAVLEPADDKLVPQGKKNKNLGSRGEKAAERFLVRRGMEILERNWVCNAGEADLIARDGDDIVFIEVKTRSNLDKGFPAEAVTKAKRHKYEKIAAYYLHDLEDVPEAPVRFDIVSILVVAENRALLKHHQNAFLCGS